MGVTTIQMSTVLIITLSWLAIMLLVLVVCRMAAAGDRAMRIASAEGHDGKRSFERTGIRTPTLPYVANPRYVAYRLTHRPEVERLQPAAREHVGDRAQQNLDVGP